MHEQRLYRILTAASKSLEEMKANASPPVKPLPTHPANNTT
jgi:hypothetical protein